MTVGQRIAQKRKELGLSQEALGEQLGVSRQSIYKWESDTVLPEVEKLIALSRIFSVSVGWLLGEEDAETGEEGPAPELTDTQLAMVREIVEQYLSALPKEEAASRKEPDIRDKWPRILAGVGAVALIAVLFFQMSVRLNWISADYQSVQNTMESIRMMQEDLQERVDTQIGSISGRVEDILQSQNELTAEYRTEYLSSDLAANTAIFSVYVVPKTYQPGMTARFQARSGGDTVELTVAEPDGNNAFTGEITCPLTDDITLSVVLVTGEVEQTQWLDDYSGLYSSSFPRLSFAFGMPFVDENGVLPAQSPQNGTGIEAFDPFDGSELSTEGMELRKGLFRDDQLLMWYEEAVVERSLNGVSTPVRVWYRPQAVTLEPGHEYVEAILYTDEYGRQRVYQDAPLTYDETAGDWTSSGIYKIVSDPIDWEF